MRLGVALIVVALVLAGCLGQESNSGGPAKTPTPTPTPAPTNEPEPLPTRTLMLGSFSFEDCRGLTMMSAMPADVIQAWLPEPFTVAATNGQAQYAVDLFSCAELVTPGATVEDTWFGQVYTFVEKPEAYPEYEADVYEYAWTILAGQDILAELWVAAGYQVHSGPTSSDYMDVAGVLRSVVAMGNYSVDSVTQAVSTFPVSLSFARFGTHDSSGVLVWTGAYELGDAAVGNGRLRIDDADPAKSQADALGAFTADALSYRNARIGGQDLWLHL